MPSSAQAELLGSSIAVGVAGNERAITKRNDLLARWAGPAIARTDRRRVDEAAGKGEERCRRRLRPKSWRQMPLVWRRSDGAPSFSCAIGNFFELFDFTIYGYFAVAIARAFYPSGSMFSTFATFGAAFLMRPVGAIVLGAYGDRMGRRAALVVTIGLMAAATGFTGLIPSYKSIGVWAPFAVLLCRLLQGFSTGGEWGGAAAFLVEYSPPGKRGDLQLRQEITRRALRWGQAQSPEDIVITCGCTEALALALKTVARPGDTIAIESPTYFGLLHVLEALDLKALELPTDSATGVELDGRWSGPARRNDHCGMPVLLELQQSARLHDAR